jgi:hypothetical protein
VSDLREVEQRRETGIDIIYLPEMLYRGLTRPAAAKDALRCRKTRLDLPNESSRAALDAGGMRLGGSSIDSCSSGSTKVVVNTSKSARISPSKVWEEEGFKATRNRGTRHLPRNVPMHAYLLVSSSIL